MKTYRQPFKGDYPITQRFGEIVPGVTKDNKPHTGIDYACPLNTPILASADGTVMRAGWDSTGYGNMVLILHEKDKSTLYAHLSECNVFDNQKVRQGDVIGWSGYTGNVFPEGILGAHLHFEARKRWNDISSAFDPMDLPLVSFADFAGEVIEISEETPQNASGTSQLKEPDQLGQKVVVACPDGAKVFNPDWSMRYAGFPQGTQLYFTGRTAKRPGFPDYKYCEVYEEPRKFYVAVHDGRTQILDNDAEE